MKSWTRLCCCAAIAITAIGANAQTSDNERAAALLARHGPECGVTAENVDKLTEAQQQFALACIKERMRASQAKALRDLGRNFDRPAPPRLDGACYSDCVPRYSAPYCQRACGY